MAGDVDLVEVWRGGILESRHRGHAVICGPDGSVEQAWGDPDAVILPRSSCKMIQALPLLESGAADALGLDARHFALACASHQSAPEHVSLVEDWLETAGVTEDALICGAHAPWDKDLRHQLIRDGALPRRVHNNCSGKHAGFLSVTRHLGAGPDYVSLDHPVQAAVREALAELTGEDTPGYGIDGCSAPNFATTVRGLARAMTVYATADGKPGARARAAVRLRDAMRTHPHLVAGEGKAVTELMRAGEGRAAIKFGAEAVYTIIIPETGQGAALKISDGATRAADCMAAALLVRFGVLDPEHPAAQKFLHGPIRSVAGEVVGRMTPAPEFIG